MSPEGFIEILDLRLTSYNMKLLHFLAFIDSTILSGATYLQGKRQDFD